VLYRQLLPPLFLPLYFSCHICIGSHNHVSRYIKANSKNEVASKVIEAAFCLYAIDKANIWLFPRRFFKNVTVLPFGCDGVHPNLGRTAFSPRKHHIASTLGPHWVHIASSDPEVPKRYHQGITQVASALQSRRNERIIFYPTFFVLNMLENNLCKTGGWHYILLLNTLMQY
jgi:hypothetical protein